MKNFKPITDKENIEFLKEENKKLKAQLEVLRDAMIGILYTQPMGRETETVVGRIITTAFKEIEEIKK